MSGKASRITIYEARKLIHDEKASDGRFSLRAKTITGSTESDHIYSLQCRLHLKLWKGVPAWSNEEPESYNAGVLMEERSAMDQAENDCADEVHRRVMDVLELRNIALATLFRQPTLMQKLIPFQYVVSPAELDFAGTGKELNTIVEKVEATYAAAKKQLMSFVLRKVWTPKEELARILRDIIRECGDLEYNLRKINRRLDAHS